MHSDYIIIENEVENYKDQQATIDDINVKLVELQVQYDALQVDRNKLQGQVDAKKAEQERVAQEKVIAQQATQETESG